MSAWPLNLKADTRRSSTAERSCLYYHTGMPSQGWTKLAAARDMDPTTRMHAQLQDVQSVATWIHLAAHLVCDMLTCAYVHMRNLEVV